MDATARAGNRRQSPPSFAKSTRRPNFASGPARTLLFLRSLLLFSKELVVRARIWPITISETGSLFHAIGVLIPEILAAFRSMSRIPAPVLHNSLSLLGICPPHLGSLITWLTGLDLYHLGSKGGNNPDASPIDFDDGAWVPIGEYGQPIRR